MLCLVLFLCRYSLYCINQAVWIIFISATATFSNARNESGYTCKVCCSKVRSRFCIVNHQGALLTNYIHICRYLDPVHPAESNDFLLQTKRQKHLYGLILLSRSLFSYFNYFVTVTAGELVSPYGHMKPSSTVDFG